MAVRRNIRLFSGTGSETRTRKVLPPADFESAASTNSTIPAGVGKGLWHRGHGPVKGRVVLWPGMAPVGHGSAGPGCCHTWLGRGYPMSSFMHTKGMPHTLRLPPPPRPAPLPYFPSAGSITLEKALPFQRYSTLWSNFTCARPVAVHSRARASRPSSPRQSMTDGLVPGGSL